MNVAKTVKTTKKVAKNRETAPARVGGVPVAHGVGRRKSSVARVWLRRGSGAMIVNGREYATYFDTDSSRKEAFLPMNIVPTAQGYDVEVNVVGGGLQGQSGATKVALARAFLALNETNKTLLRDHGLLTVDARVKERKKYGQKAARRRFQFVKR